MLPSLEQLSALQTNARQAARVLRAPFRRRTWHGLQGNWQGAGAGSSLDFQDHRPYIPGDDPRHVNWQAYARTGQYTMKLYRQEVSPMLDLVLDLSGSMFLESLKAARVAELLYWAVDCGQQAGASMRLWRWRGSAHEPFSVHDVDLHGWGEPGGQADPGVLSEIPWRHGSLRLIISDLLWPGDAQPILQALGGHGASPVIYAPYSPEESEPAWSGNLEMVDAETNAVRIQRVDDAVRRRYTAAYQRHFGLWSEQALRYHVPLARISASGSLVEALRDAAAVGAAEIA